MEGNNSMKLNFFPLFSLIIITFSFQLVLSNCRLVNEGSNQVQNIFSRGSNSNNSLATEIIALPVVVESVKRSDISSFLSATTTLSAERSLDIVSSSAGTVVKGTAKEGDRVVIMECRPLSKTKSFVIIEKEGNK